MGASPLCDRPSSLGFARSGRDAFVDQSELDRAGIHRFSQEAVVTIVGWTLEGKADGVHRQPRAREIRIAPLGP